ncbi:hypothetical protein [Actinoplanes sp. HUAS TT8]|uniref:hypothetical protein n=1 Tax=Actinoplanes sp. HUAS TT8 TaxID=3447453 RepID=UPI003F5242AF
MDFEDAIHALLFRRPGEFRPNSTTTRLEQGVYHADFHDDPDNVYLVTVRQVPRVTLPLDGPVVVGEAGGVRALLVKVALANHVEVTLDAEDSPAARATADERRAAWLAWAEQPGGDPPSWPGEVFMHFPIAVTDDLGTVYRFTTGAGGGEDTPWRSHRNFLPVPPPQARRLTIGFPAGEIELALP